MSQQDLKLRDCPVCNSSVKQAEHYMDENYDVKKINNLSFSSRKNPEFMCHHLVRCIKCDLVFADNPPGIEELSESYHNADFDSVDEAQDAARSYSKSLSILFKSLNNRDKALEIGTGTGAFLDELKKNNFNQVIGVEPSIKSIEASPQHRKSWIINDIFKPYNFEKDSLDLICCFMTLEHIRDLKMVFELRNLIKRNGAIALVVHDHRALINRILGKKSPIIDIEHMQLFSKKSITELLSLAGFNNIKVKSFRNTYSLKYWIRLLPINNTIKFYLIKLLSIIKLDDIKLSLNVGNLIAYGYNSKNKE